MPSEISANFVAIPINAVKIIQTSAPGPPITIAVATPAMLPEPTIAETDVIAA